MSDFNDYLRDATNEVSKIMSRLYLSCFRTADCHKLLKHYSIRTVLSFLSKEPKFKKLGNIEYYFFQIHDTPDQDLLRMLPHAIDLIASARSAGHNVLVHCQVGVSRSASVVIAYVMKIKNWRMEDALTFVQSRRKIVNPNVGFLEQLKLFETIDYSIDLNNILARKYFYFRWFISGCYFEDTFTSWIEYRNLFLAFSKKAASTRFLCKKCNQNLFDEDDIIPTSPEDSPEPSAVYIYPVQWICLNYKYLRSIGYIACPGCKRNVGKYNWNSFSDLRKHLTQTHIGKVETLQTLDIPLVFAFYQSKIYSVNEPPRKFRILPGKAIPIL